MASLQRTASGKWTCRVYIGLKDGKPQYKRVTADTKKEAERLAQLFKLENTDKKPKSDLTLREAMERYIAAKEDLLSPSTVAGYIRILKHRFQSIMSAKLCDLTQEDYQIAVNSEAKILSAKSVENAVGLLTATLKLQKINIDKLTLPQEDKIEIVIPTDEELARLCDTSREWDIELPVYLAAYMGLRRSEICALKLKKDIDLNKHTLKIVKAVVINKNNEAVVKKPKKTSSTRILPIPDVVMEVVKRALENNYVMPTVGALESRFIDMKRSIDLDHITLHSLRHYFASVLVTLEVPDFYALKLMGHKTDVMLKTVYQHMRQDYMQEVSCKIDSFYTKNIKQ